MRILWLKTELLHPVDKGGRIRTYEMLRRLHERHRVTYLALDGEADAVARTRSAEYCDELIRVPHALPCSESLALYLEVLRNLASPLPWALDKYRSTPMRRAIDERLRRGDVDVIVSDFLMPSVNLAWQGGARTVPLVLFQHNVEAAIWRRRALNDRWPLPGVHSWLQYRRMQEYERRACRRFDHVICVSPEDAQVHRSDYGIAHVSSVPTGVDLDYFRPAGDRQQKPFELLFIGSMDWFPNQEGIIGFVDRVLGLVQRAVPRATLTIVGRNPPPSVRALERHPGVTVTGGVPDVRPYLETAAIFVVPLRIGGGTRLKIFEAMAMEKAVVSTRVGAEGLPVTAGRNIAIADGDEEFAKEIVDLLRAPDRARAIGQAAAEHVRAHFGWDVATSRFERILAGVVDGKAASERSVRAR